MHLPLDQETSQLHILEFWKKNKLFFPRLSQVAQYLLAVPASSAPSERDFSAAGYTLSERRLRLTADAVDSLTFLSKIPYESL